MKKANSQIIISVLGVLLISIIGVFLYFNQTGSTPETTPETSKNTEIADPKVMTSDQYVNYTPEVLANSTGRRVLFFYANWCPTCQPIDKELKMTNKLPEDVTVFKVNYNDSDTDENEDALAKKHNITYQHTFVIIDENGEPLTTWNGDGLSRILEEI